MRAKRHPPRPEVIVRDPDIEPSLFQSYPNLRDGDPLPRSNPLNTLTVAFAVFWTLSVIWIGLAYRRLRGIGR